MNVIVFGGTGWVGHHIVAAFHSAGHAVTICSRGQKATYLDELPNIRRIVGDKRQADDVASIFKEQFDVVIDSVPTVKSVAHIQEHATGLQRYIHCSSTGGYAPLPAIPGDEMMPYDHFMNGWQHKSDTDSLALDLCHRRGFPVTVIRPSYITGPGLLPLDNQGGRRPDFLADIAAGNTLDLPNDGQALLQPIHVKDLAASFLLAAETRRSIGQIYNICLEKAVTLTRYIELNAAALGTEARINYLPVADMLEKYGSSVEARGLHFLATHMCYDISKAREQLGYQPSYTTEAAIVETARWAIAQRV